MAKYAVVAWVVALTTVSFANASTMSMQERMSVGRKIDKAVPFAKEKYLPGSFVKELEKGLESAEDKAQLKKLQGNWPKYYSKDIGYRSQVNSFEITYKKVPMVNVKVTSLNPYTVKINGGSEMMIRKGRFFADMSEAFKDAGYDFSASKTKKKKTAFFSLLVPEAMAEGTSAMPPTVENSLFILGLATYNQAPDGSLRTAMDITETLASGHFYYPGVEAVKCSGERMQGTYKQGEDVSVEFMSDRKNGVYMSAGGHHLVGKRVGSEATGICQALAAGVVLDLKVPVQMRAYGTHRSACLFLQAARPSAGLNCTANGETAPTQDALKAECDAMKAVGLSSSFEFYACKDANCKESEMTKLPEEVRNLRQLGAWQAFGPALEESLQAVRDEFKTEIENGQIKEDGGTFVIVPPDKMFASRTSKFQGLVARIPKAPKEDKSVSNFDFRIAAMGFAGLLDCCYDSECKAKVYEKGGLELQPADAVH